MTRLALIGCGAWGRRLARAFHRLGVLAAFAETNDAAARCLFHEFPDWDSANRFPMPLRLSFHDTLHDTNLNAVVIATEAEYHVSLAAEALSCGKDVFVEKPVGFRSTAVGDLCGLAKSRGRVLMAGHVLLYHPAFVVLQEQRTRGSIGSLRSFHSIRENQTGGPVENLSPLWSLAPHDVALALELFGETPRHIQAQRGQGDAVTVHLGFSDKREAVIRVADRSPVRRRELRLGGSSGALVWQESSSRPSLLLCRPDKTNPSVCTEQLLEYSTEEPLLREARHFLQSIATRETPLSGPDHLLNVTRVLEAAQESLDRLERPMAPLLSPR